MSSSIPQNDVDQVVVQGFPISSNEPYVVYGFPVTAQTQYINSMDSNTGRANPSTVLESTQLDRVESHEHDDDNITQGLCLNECFFIFYFTLVLFFIGFFLLFLLVPSHDHSPVFNVESASVSILNNSASWNIGILTRNPNKNMEFGYNEFDLRVSHKGDHIFGTKTMGFNSGAKSETLLNAAAVIPLANITSNFIANTNPDGVGYIDMILKGTVIVMKGSRQPQKKSIKVLCKDFRIKVSDDDRDLGDVVKGENKCSVKMGTLI